MFAARVNSIFVAGANLTVGGTVCLPVERLAPRPVIHFTMRLHDRWRRMIGRETRMLIRQYLEQDVSKSALARQFGISRDTISIDSPITVTSDHPRPQLAATSGHGGRLVARGPRCTLQLPMLTAGVNSTVVASAHPPVGSTAWLPAESLAPVQ